MTRFEIDCRNVEIECVNAWHEAAREFFVFREAVEFLLHQTLEWDAQPEYVHTGTIDLDNESEESKAACDRLLSKLQAAKDDPATECHACGIRGSHSYTCPIGGHPDFRSTAH
jgi:hypothetical protein